MTTATQNVIEKARRLFADGRVYEIDDTGASLFTVQGDSGTYLVALVPDDSPMTPSGWAGAIPPAQTCSCPHAGPTACSHIAAATLYRMTVSPVLAVDPFAGLDRGDL